MKTLKESLVKKNQRLKKHLPKTKSDLKSGCVVRYRFGDMAMYFDSQDVLKSKELNYLKDIRPKDKLPVFVNYPNNYIMVSGYDEDLTLYNHDYDIIEIYPIHTQTKQLTSKQLEQLVAGITPVKIN